MDILFGFLLGITTSYCILFSMYLRSKYKARKEFQQRQKKFDEFFEKANLGEVLKKAFDDLSTEGFAHVRFKFPPNDAPKSLEDQLHEAINSGEFEEAARLRDKIKARK